MTNHQDWERLGRMLLAQRVRLGYPVRAKFAEANGLSHARTVSDIENAKRTNFEPATLAQIEQLYQWQVGSVAAVLAGGDPSPIDGPLPSRASRTTADVLNEGQTIINLGTRAIHSLAEFEQALRDGVNVGDLRDAYYRAGVLPDVLNMWFAAMRITGVIDPLREHLRNEPDLRERLHLPSPSDPEPGQESDDDGRESAAKSEAEGTSAQDAANDTAARERSESTDSEGPARGPHSRTRSGAKRRRSTQRDGGTAESTTL